MKIACLVALAACGGEVASRYSDAKIGAPCAPAVESDPTFTGFDVQEVAVELPSPNADPGQLVCLVNHFRGRATCPYGQDEQGEPPAGATACTTLDGNAVMGKQSSARVDAQCTDRHAADVVTWSCRCANALGTTDDGATYCSCGDGLTCAQLVVPVPGSDAVSGAYCIKTGTAYLPSSSCHETCDPISATCR